MKKIHNILAYGGLNADCSNWPHMIVHKFQNLNLFGLLWKISNFDTVPSAQQDSPILLNSFIAFWSIILSYWKLKKKSDVKVLFHIIHLISALQL